MRLARFVVVAAMLLVASPAPASAAAAPSSQRWLGDTVLRAGGQVELHRVLMVAFDLRGRPGGGESTLTVRARPRATRLVAYRVRRGGSTYRVVGRPVVGVRSGSATRFRFTLPGRTLERFVIADRPARPWRLAARPRLRLPVRAVVQLPEPTAPTPAREPVMVMTAGDIACDPADPAFNAGAGSGALCRQMATSDLMLARAPDAVLPLGDTQYEHGTLDQFVASYDPSWGRLKAITHPAVGNHEYETVDAAGYFDYFNGPGIADGPAGERGKGYYSFDIGDWHVIALNSNCTIVACAAGSAQETWLRADLAAHPAACTLAMLHHPRFSSGPQGSKPSVHDLWKALHDAGADLVLSGHDHHYERFDPQTPTGVPDVTTGIREIIVGTGGEELVAAGTPIPNSVVLNTEALGVLELSLTATGYSWEFLPIDGLAFGDTGAGDCHGPPA